MLFNTHISLICSWYCYHIVCLQYTYCISYANYILKLLTIRGQSIICFNTICLNLQFHERHFMRDISYTKLRYWYILTIWNPEIWIPFCIWRGPGGWKFVRAWIPYPFFMAFSCRNPIDPLMRCAWYFLVYFSCSQLFLVFVNKVVRPSTWSDRPLKKGRMSRAGGGLYLKTMDIYSKERR